MNIQTNDIANRQINTKPITNSLSKTILDEENQQDKALIKRMQAVLSFESNLRRLTRKNELAFFAVNEIRKLLNARQVLIADCNQTSLSYKIQTISSMSDIDRNTPIIRWFEKIFKHYAIEKGLKTFQLDMTKDLEKDGHEYPFPYLYHMPLKDASDRVFAVLILTRDSKWKEEEHPIIKRIGEALSYVWSAQLGKKGKIIRSPWKRYLGIAGLLTVLAAGFFPVPLSVLAPVEVAASSPAIITAPFDGVLDDINVRSGDVVKEGDALFQMVDTDLVNRHKIAIQDAKIAKTRLLRSSRAAYQNDEALKDLSLAKTEFDLKTIEQAYAASLLKRSKAIATQSGVVLFTSKNDLMGKPVATGERIMRIADPQNTEFKINVSLKDSIIIKEGAKVRVFLDADPLHPLDAYVEHAALEAKEIPGGQLAYTITAKAQNNKNSENNETINLNDNQRVGLRGTAQILGDKVPLAFYLFRRPLSAIRQWAGL